MKLLRQRSPDYSDYDELFQNVIESWLKARNKMKVYLYIKSKVAFPVSESGARVAVAVAWLVRGTADCYGSVALYLGSQPSEPGEEELSLSYH